MQLIYEDENNIKETIQGSEHSLRSLVEYMKQYKLFHFSQNCKYYLTNGANFWEEVTPQKEDKK